MVYLHSRCYNSISEKRNVLNVSLIFFASTGRIQIMDEMQLSTEYLQVGNYIRLPLTWHDHPFLLSNFMIRNQEQIEIIKKLGIKFVYINIKNQKNHLKYNKQRFICMRKRMIMTMLTTLCLIKCNPKINASSS